MEACVSSEIFFSEVRELGSGVRSPNAFSAGQVSGVSGDSGLENTQSCSSEAANPYFQVKRLDFQMLGQLSKSPTEHASWPVSGPGPQFSAEKSSALGQSLP